MRKDTIRLETGKKIITTLIKDFVDVKSQVNLVIIQVLSKHASIICCEDNDKTIADIREDFVRLVPTQDEVHSEDKAGLAYMIRSSMIGRTMALPVIDGNIFLGNREEVMILGFPDQLEEVEIFMSVV